MIESPPAYGGVQDRVVDEALGDGLVRRGRRGCVSLNLRMGAQIRRAHVERVKRARGPDLL